jgi:hypothetical protein
MHRSELGLMAPYLFIILYCTSSIYLYCNRAFLIESTALFFTLLSLYFYSRLRSNNSASALSINLLATGFVISLSVGLLVKATTALPTMALVTGDWIWQSRIALQSRKKMREQVLLGGAIAISFALLYSWTHHADAVKQLNPIGAQLTSSALRAWNFGLASQRLQPQLWQDVVVQRMLTPVGTIPATALIAYGLWISTNRTFFLACLFLTFAPLLVFTNLHIAHAYYQASNQIFLLMAVAGSAATILEQPRQKAIPKALVIAALTILITSNLSNFHTSDWSRSGRRSSDKLAIGKLILNNTPANSAIIVFGDDWSSAFAYHSQRRAFTRPDWPSLDLSSIDVLRDSDRHLGSLPLGAVVSREPISKAALQPSCTTAHSHVIKRWHVYLCEPLNAPRPSTPF